MAECFIGVDVGTGSARAGVFDAAGHLLGSASSDIALYLGSGDFAEQSSEDIWQSVCRSVRAALAASKVSPDSIAGIGFDATCSLVVVGPGGVPLPVGDPNQPDRNIIVWMDHRAIEQAARINATGHEVLDYVGGSISPEMETPKLLWLAEHRPDTFAGTWQFFDLADYLTWRATGSLTRSLCTLTCKWTYLGHLGRWDASYFERIGLGILAGESFARIGTDVVPAGTAVGDGLADDAAQAFGIPQGVPVAAGMIDAHAGGLGTIGARGGSGGATSRVAYVMGTSACVMGSTPAPAHVPGVWGPYYSAMIPQLWLNEGGQSAAGAAIDRLLLLSPAVPVVTEAAQAAGLSLVNWLAAEVGRRGGAPYVAELVGDLHVVPEFLGNRSPFADPEAKALIAGLGMQAGTEELIGLYVAGLCGLGYGARQIVDRMREKNPAIDALVVSGGAAASGLVRQILADTTGLRVIATASAEPVLLGSAMLGAIAAGHYPDAEAAMLAMSEVGEEYLPDQHLAEWHYWRFRSFEALQSAAGGVRTLRLP